jgi:hypothetical protein
MKLHNFNQFKESLIVEKSTLSEFELPKEWLSNIHMRMGIPHDAEFFQIRNKTQLKAYLEKDLKVAIFTKYGSDGLGVDNLIGYIAISDGYIYIKVDDNGEKFSDSDRSLNKMLKHIPRGSQIFGIKGSTYKKKYDRKERTEIDNWDFIKYFEKNIGKVLSDKYQKEYDKAKDQILNDLKSLSLDDLKTTGGYKSKLSDKLDFITKRATALDNKEYGHKLEITHKMVNSR